MTIDVQVVESLLRQLPRDRALTVLATAGGGRGLYEVKRHPRLLAAVYRLAKRELEASQDSCPRCGYPQRS